MSRPPVQVGPGVVVLQGEDALRDLYFCLHAGAQKLRRDGLSAGRFERLKSTIYRALMSRPRHEVAYCVAVETESNGQDASDLLTVAEAAEVLALSRRQVQRLASELGGVRIGHGLAFRRAPVLALKQTREREAQSGRRNRIPRKLETGMDEAG